MSRASAAVKHAIDEAVRIVDGGIVYGDMGIDLDPAVGSRASDLLRQAVEKAPDDVGVRYLLAAALSLAGRIDDAREQLG